MSAKPDIVTQILEQMVEVYNVKTPRISEVLKLSAPDAHRPNDLQFMLWWAYSTGIMPPPPGFQGPGPNGEVYPPQVWVSPEGIEVYASAYELALAFAEGGDKDLRRWQGIVERNVAS